MKWDECIRPGCNRMKTRAARYCSEQCRRDARAERVAHNRESQVDASARYAPRAKVCSGCDGGFTSVDEHGDRWCSCGRLAA